MNDNMSSFTVYAIVSSVDSRIYVGLTEDVVRRVAEHNAGRVFSTKAYRPWTLLHTDLVTDRISARKREKFLKGGSGKEFLKSLRDRSIRG